MKVQYHLLTWCRVELLPKICSGPFAMNLACKEFIYCVSRNSITRSTFVVELKTRLVHSYSLPKMSNFVFVRNVEEEERMQIGLTYTHHSQSQPRMYNLDRAKSETIGVSLERLKANISKHVNKKKKKKKTETPSEPDDFVLPISLQIDNTALAVDKINSESWSKNAILMIGDIMYNVKVNSPTVTLLKLPENIMAGFPVFPKINLEFGNVNESKYEWFISEKAIPTSDEIGRENKNVSNIAPEVSPTGCDGKNPETSTAKSSQKHGESTAKLPIPNINVNRLKWNLVSSSRNFAPDSSAVDCHVKLTVTPTSNDHEGVAVDSVSKVSVSAGPGLCPFDTRHLYTEECTGHSCLRLMSYNILADLYADSDFSRDHLFPHCPPYALHIDYRKQLLMKEIIGYRSDVLCLQEVDYKVFVNDIHPGLASHGTDTVFKMKGGTVNEGLVTGYRADRFRLVGRHDSVLSDLLTSDESCKSYITDQIAANTQLSERLLVRTTAVQVTALEMLDQPQHLLCMGNTHLYFHPQADHIRILQIATCLKHIENVVSSYKQQGYSVSVILCGDLNSSPHKGSIQLITENSVAASHGDWMAGGAEENLPDLTFSHDLHLHNAITDCEYTNYVGGFHAVLDYIFVDSRTFRVSRVIPPPSHDEVTEYTALPSITCPSDHIAQVCEVDFII